MRKRSELLAHVQPTTSQDHRPEIGQKIAAEANRHGVAERFAEPAVHKNTAVDLGLITDDDALLTDLALAVMTTATPYDAPTFYRLRSIPREGKSWPSGCAMKCMRCTPSPACRRSSRTAAWSRVRGNPQANARVPRARNSATRPSSGPCPKRPCCAYAIIRQGSSIWPDGITRMARAKR
jgi:hypothetical protein